MPKNEILGMDDSAEKGVLSLQVGDRAPDFVLPGSNGEDIHLQDLLDDNVVLVFFSDTFTPFATGQADSFLHLHESLSNIGVSFIGISTEPLATLKTFIDNIEIPFLMVSDFDRKVSKAYGVYAEKYGGLRCVALPSIVVVDVDGLIDYIWVGHGGEGMPSAKEIADWIIKSKLD
ncbi:MAG: peroxiredoxin family protein [Candidatus Thorarchaeota archaeon]|jgi:peroxiredoxin Q/BCP